MAAKLTKNLGPPSSTLHVANLPEDLTHVEVKVNIQSLDHVATLKLENLQDMFIERGFTVKESKECGAGGSMVRYSFPFFFSNIHFNTICAMFNRLF